MGKLEAIAARLSCWHSPPESHRPLAPTHATSSVMVLQPLPPPPLPPRRRPELAFGRHGNRGGTSKPAALTRAGASVTSRGLEPARFVAKVLNSSSAFETDCGCVIPRLNLGSSRVPCWEFETVSHCNNNKTTNNISIKIRNCSQQFDIVRLAKLQ